MKTDLKVKYLQYLNEKKQDEGFTLIELLVVIIIIGILAAIALPSFLNQAQKAKQTEAKTYVGSMNKGEQAYYTEKSNFVGTPESDSVGTKAIPVLGIGIKTQTVYYVYGAQASNGGTAAFAASYSQLTGQGGALKNYVGFVELTTSGSGGDYTSYATLCETISAGNAGEHGVTDSPGTEPCHTDTQLAVGGTK